ETAMGIARETGRLGLAARGQAKVKVRQPLREAVVVASGAERAAIERLGDVIASELNVKRLRFVAEADELGSYEIKPNYRTLGPRFGRAMPQVAAAVAGLDPAHVSSAARNNEAVRISVDGSDHALAPEDLLLSMQPLEGYQLEREGSHAVAHERSLNGRMTRGAWEGAHRVLSAVGTIAPTALGDPEKVRRKLRREGVRFEGGRADPALRWRP